MSDLRDLLDAVNSIETGVVRALAFSDPDNVLVMDGLHRAADGAVSLRNNLEGYAGERLRSA